MTESLTSEADAVIGERLRAARLQAGLSVEQLAEVTRISKAYLLAIEEGRFDRLPGPAYVRGFIRLYAAQVALDPDSLVQDYQQLRRPLSPAGSPGSPKLKRVAFTPDGRRRWLVTGILLLLVLAMAYLTDSDQEPERAPLAAPAPPAPAPAPVQGRMSSTVPVLPPAPAAAPALEGDEGRTAAVQEPAVAGGGIFLRIRADQECWLNIDIDGEMGRQYSLRAGDVIEWKAARRFSLDIGNAGGIQAEFNGKPLEPLGREGTPVHLELTADGVQ